METFQRGGGSGLQEGFVKPGVETGGQMSLSPPHRLSGELGSLAACTGMRGDACGGDTPFHGLNTEEQFGVTESQPVTAREDQHRGSFQKACGRSQSCK